MIAVLGGAAVVTTLLGLISRDAWTLYQLGGWAVGDALVIAWARQYPDVQLYRVSTAWSGCAAAT